MLDDLITELEEELRHAMLAGDAKTLGRLMGEALIVTTETDPLAEKVADLDLYRTGRLRLTKLEASERVVRRHDSMAVVGARMDVAGTLDGQPFGGAFRYSRLWRHSRKGWRVIVAHVSSVVE